MTKQIYIRVIPRASKNKILKQSDGSFKIHLTAVPTDGKANKQLIKFLSTTWKIPQSQIKIIKGQKNQSKIIEIKQ